jgi:hypothetical protein
MMAWHGGFQFFTNVIGNIFFDQFGFMRELQEQFGWIFWIWLRKIKPLKMKQGVARNTGTHDVSKILLLYMCQINTSF